MEMAKEGIVHIKNMKSNKMNVIQHIAKNLFTEKYSDVIPFVFINLFISNCDLIAKFFLNNCNRLQLHLFCN